MRESVGAFELIGSHINAALEPRFTPWDHWVAQHIFPPRYFNEMLAHLPRPADMERFKPNRHFMWIVKHGEYPKLQDPFWETFRLEVLSRLYGAMKDVFGGGFTYGCELVYDTPGYSLGPHTDDLDKHVTGVIYLQGAGGEGTSLYIGPSDPHGKGHKWDEGHIYHQTLPLIPNSGLFFQRSNVSFHAVRPTKYPRWTLAVDIFK